MKPIVVSLTLVLLSVIPISAGNLEPPGPPAPTMKTIAEAEPRTPIHASDFPLTISNAGSYYLTENVVATSAAITVTADNVSIDLRGFTLGSAAAPVSIAGPNYVSLRNGNLVGAGIAVSVNLGSHATLDSLRSINTRFALGNSPRVSNCNLEVTGGLLFTCGSECSVEHSSFGSTLNGGVTVGSHSLLSYVEITNSGGLSVGGSTMIAHSRMRFDDVQLLSTGDVSILDSSISCSGDECVHLGDNSRVVNCVIRGGVTIGVILGRGSQVQNSQIFRGLVVGDASVVKDNLLEGSGAKTLRVGSNSLIAGNKCTDGSPGIQVDGSGNRIEDNSLVFNVTFGLNVLGTGNTIHRNSASKNPSGNYQIVAGNDVGPIGSSAAATSPWANIVY